MGAPVMEAHISDIPGLTFNSAGFAVETSFKKLQAEFADIAELISKQFGEISLRLLNSPTLDDFRSLRERVFSSYVKLSMALSHIVLANLDYNDYAQLTQESLSETEKEFMVAGNLYLGGDAYREVRFSISTLKSAQRWIPRLVSTQASDPAEDRELARNFLLANSWAHFHLECLKLAVHRRETLSQDILQELLDGLRLSVMAYSYVRAALDLRDIPGSRYGEKLDTQWDAEDEALANSD